MVYRANFPNLKGPQNCKKNPCLNDTEGELRVRYLKWDLCFVIYMFLSNNPSSGDINSSNLPCCLWPELFLVNVR